MPVIKSIKDKVLLVDDHREVVQDELNKYVAFLDLLCSERYSFQKEAIRAAITFLVSDKYPTTKALADENYQNNLALKTEYRTFGDFLNRIELHDRRSASLDLVTGSGKSFVMYGIARIALAEGFVDKVLVLCPSLTIEEGLKEKFHQLGTDTNINTVLEEVGAVWNNPEIKSANDPIEPGDICVENIHAVYERTGSSIADSFKGLGDRTLVLNDEAHHIFSGVIQENRWLNFLKNSDYGFTRMVHVTGTPYIQDDYFPDVIYRYGLRSATEDGVIKRIDYVKAREQGGRDHGWDETWHYHDQNRTEYLGTLKPITIVVTKEIADCVRVWNELVEYLVSKEHITRQEAEERAIWVVSTVPAPNTETGKAVRAIVGEGAEKIRKHNLQTLKMVDDDSNPVEWIVSVSMLTEGWDVKNVFQVVPHENRAFNSKLLISQVLGRGLRVPVGVEGAMLTVNNHEQWEGQISGIMEEILEVENRLSWGYHAPRSQHAFPLYNLRYEVEQKGEETKKKPATNPSKVDYSPQGKQWTEIADHSLRGNINVVIESKDNLTIREAVRRLKIFLNEKDSTISKKWPSKKLEQFIVENLKQAKQSVDFISRENLGKTQAAFAPMFRKTGKTAPRMVMVAKDLEEVGVADMHRQSFSEASLQRDTHVFYTDDAVDTFKEDEQKRLWYDFMELVELYKLPAGKKAMAHEKQVLARHLTEIRSASFKTSAGVLVSSSSPEKKFIYRLITHADLFDGFIKSPDKGFYSFPYSYKPATKAKTHVKQENFNPDFFIKLVDKQVVLVVEIKQDGDDSNQNRAKNRDGLTHFSELNKCLQRESKGWVYHFYFLSPENYPEFFQAIEDENYEGWKSTLMPVNSTGKAAES